MNFERMHICARPQPRRIRKWWEDLEGGRGQGGGERGGKREESSSILGHVYRAFSVIRDVVCLSDNDYQRCDPEYKWLRESGILLPDMCLNPLPDKKRVSCKCEGKCSSKKCSCKAENEKCTAFCHGKKSACLNWFVLFCVLVLEMNVLLNLTAMHHYPRFAP